MEVIKKGHTFESVIYDQNEIDDIWDQVKDEVKRTDCEFLDHHDIKILLKEKNIADYLNYFNKIYLLN